MARVSTYLNFPRNTEEAFAFYKSVFKTEYACPIARFSDVPASPDCPPAAEADKNLIMHIALPTLGDHVLMGTDAPESMGFNCKGGNNVYINLEPDSREDAERLFKELSEGGKVEMPLQDMFWGAYFASFADKFGINWMINCTATKEDVSTATPYP